MGTPVVFLDPRSKGAEAYKAFAWEFMAKNPTRFDAAKEPPKSAAAPAPAEPSRQDLAQGEGDNRQPAADSAAANL